MTTRITYKTVLIIVLAVLVISLLPGVTAVWAEANPKGNQLNPSPEPLRPSAQGEESGRRPPSFLGDMLVQFGEQAEGIAPQSDGAGIETVPGAAFIHTNELGSGTEAQDWFFSFNSGFLTNDSFTKSGINKEVCLTAPVYLPLDVVITSFRSFILDNSSASDVAIFLDRTASFGGWTELAAVQSTGNSSSIQTVTDPSIFATSGANVVAPEFNYHVSLCLPAGSDFSIRVYGAQVIYSKKSDLKNVYLPVVFKPDPNSLLSRVYVTNLSGGSVIYTILGTPQGNITCTVPNGAKKQFCDKAFTANTYNWKAQLHCGTLGPKPREFTPGNNYPADFRCD